MERLGSAPTVLEMRKLRSTCVLVQRTDGRIDQGVRPRQLSLSSYHHKPVAAAGDDATVWLVVDTCECESASASETGSRERVRTSGRPRRRRAARFRPIPCAHSPSWGGPDLHLTCIHEYTCTRDHGSIGAGRAVVSDRDHGGRRRAPPTESEPRV